MSKYLKQKGENKVYVNSVFTFFIIYLFYPI